MIVSVMTRFLNAQVLFLKLYLLSLSHIMLCPSPYDVPHMELIQPVEFFPNLNCIDRIDIDLEMTPKK